MRNLTTRQGFFETSNNTINDTKLGNFTEMSTKIMLEQMTMTTPLSFDRTATFLDNLTTSSYNTSTYGDLVNRTDSITIVLPDENVLQTVSFYCLVIILPIICLLGIIGNILNLAVLCQRNMRKLSTNCFLTGLAVSDLFLCTISLPASLCLIAKRYIIPSNNTDIHSYIDKFSIYNSYVSYYLVNTFLTCTSWLTMAVTLERLIVIRFPHRVKLICTVKNARTVIPILFVSSALIHLIKCFEYEVTSKGLLVTELGSNLLYQGIMYWVNISVSVLVPFLFLVITNSILIYSLVVYNKRSQFLHQESSQQRRQMIHITTSVIAIVTVFIICHSLGVYTACNIAINTKIKVYSKDINLVFVTINNTLVVLNSAVNFILYCLINSKFRQVFCKILCCCCQKNQGETKSSPIVRNINRFKLSSMSGNSTRSTSIHSSHRSSPTTFRSNRKISEIVHHDMLERKMSSTSSNNNSLDLISNIDNSQNHPEASLLHNADTTHDLFGIGIDSQSNRASQGETNESTVPITDSNEKLEKRDSEVNHYATLNKRNLNRSLSDRRVLPPGGYARNEEDNVTSL